MLTHFKRCDRCGAAATLAAAADNAAAFELGHHVDGLEKVQIEQRVGPFVGRHSNVVRRRYHWRTGRADADALLAAGRMQRLRVGNAGRVVGEAGNVRQVQIEIDVGDVGLSSSGGSQDVHTSLFTQIEM